MRSLLSSLLVVFTLCLFLMPIGGCPTDGVGPVDTNGDGADGADGADEEAVDTSVFTVVLTDISLFHDASLECGDDLIVFGTGTVTGVSYIIPSEDPTEATPVPGEFRSDGFAIAGKKILLFGSDGHMEVFDTESETLTEIPSAQIHLQTFPTGDYDDVDSPVVADGELAVTRNDDDEVEDGSVLKLVDVGGDTPQITALNNPPVNVTQIVIDSTDQVVITFGGNQFFVYDITQPEADPEQIDLSGQGNIQGPFAYHDGYIIYVAARHPENIRLLSVDDGTSIVLDDLPGDRDLTLAIDGGKYAYFLERDAYDTYSVVYRAAVGVVPQTDAVEGGEPGADPREQERPWEGYGNDVAITPDGSWIFISGDEGINVEAEYLQVSAGGAFAPFPDGGDYINASDVDAGAAMVAFKTGNSENTKLGYIMLPD